MSDQLFEGLALREPTTLLRLIQSDSLKDHALTYAAEALRHLDRDDELLEVFIKLLQHPTPYVREGALRGLSEDYISHPKLWIMVDAMITDDPDRDIRDLALEIMGDE